MQIKFTRQDARGNGLSQAKRGDGFTSAGARSYTRAPSSARFGMCYRYAPVAPALPGVR